MLRTARARLKSVSPYSQSRFYGADVPKKEKENAQDYEARTWRNRLHVNGDGFVFIPPMGFKNCISDAARFLGRQIPGKGKSTYTKHFGAGVLVVEGPVLGVKAEEVPGEWLMVPADGKRGGGKRVMKCFPFISEWQADVEFVVLDEVITKEVFEEHLAEAGRFIGIGRFRPQNWGYYGRFSVESVSWSEA